MGEIWDDVIDAENNSYVPKDKALEPVSMRNNREQWYTPYFQPCQKQKLAESCVVGVNGTTEYKSRWIRAGLTQDSGFAANKSQSVLSESRGSNSFTRVSNVV